MSENRQKTGVKKRTAEEFAFIQACKAKSPDALKVIESLMHDADKDAVRWRLPRSSSSEPIRHGPSGAPADSKNQPD